jgi:hypothetical protein
MVLLGQMQHLHLFLQTEDLLQELKQLQFMLVVLLQDQQEILLLKLMNIMALLGLRLQLILNQLKKLQEAELKQLQYL